MAAFFAVLVSQLLLLAILNAPHGIIIPPVAALLLAQAVEFALAFFPTTAQLLWMIPCVKKRTTTENTVGLMFLVLHS